ncbi:efflux RND transporter periplasmic adaptor subunit [Akkermansiaceae bacterium]|nr:efflux RND transporter periplasmic adaptor subunit [Akkermansiaceae bacterium]MDB4544364.1 efflux RND transporter periplasmic adaptor subunit [Akkermansiaceae bacterium]
MKSSLLKYALLAGVWSSAFAEDRVNLSESAVENLGIEVVESEEITFESTFFVIGRLQEIPSNHSVVSSRIPGRVTKLNVISGDPVEKGDIVIELESRAPGNPPPTISLRAPASGIVADSHVRLGEPVEPSNEMMDILDLTKLWAVASVPQQEAGKLKIGTKARIKIAAKGDELVEGELIRFGTTADVTSGTFEAIFLIDNPKSELRPGMRAEFSIVTATREDVTVVPREAVQGDATNRVVYVADFDLPNSFVKSSVVTGEENDQYIEIKSGLFPGDEVVTKGAYLLGFSGGGNLSLKEVLDAAHGHEHNEDGSEITDEQKADEHDHEEIETSPVNKLLAFSNVILLILLVLSGIKLAGKQAA